MMGTWWRQRSWYDARTQGKRKQQCGNTCEQQLQGLEAARYLSRRIGEWLWISKYSSDWRVMRNHHSAAAEDSLNRFPLNEVSFSRRQQFCTRKCSSSESLSDRLLFRWILRAYRLSKSSHHAEGLCLHLPIRRTNQWRSHKSHRRSPREQDGTEDWSAFIQKKW